MDVSSNVKLPFLTTDVSRNVNCHPWPLGVSNNVKLHSSPLDVSNNLSGYCISNLVLVSAFGMCMYRYALVFPYIFLLVDCFEWALIGHIEKCRVHSVLWQFQMGGLSKFYFSLYFLISWLFWMGSHWSHCKAQSSLCALAVWMGGGSIVSFTFPYIFLLVDCFKWALIGHIEKRRVHSVLWQFQMGVYQKFYFSLYFLISWLFWMGSHWSHCKAQSSPCALAVLNGKGVYCKFYFSLYFPISWLFQMGSHWSHWKAKSSLCALAVSNGGSDLPPRG